MPKRDAEFFVLDMLLSIDRIGRYAGNFEIVEDFMRDEVACNVILRDLSIIGEAMNHVLQSKKVGNLIKPHWRYVVDFRNVVIHEYFGLSYDEIFSVIKKDIPALEKELISFIQDFEDKDFVIEVIIDAQEELQSMMRTESLKYLAKIKLLILKQ